MRSYLRLLPNVDHLVVTEGDSLGQTLASRHLRDRLPNVLISVLYQGLLDAALQVVQHISRHV